MNFFRITILLSFLFVTGFAETKSWELGPFERLDCHGPILHPNKKSLFFCPISHKKVRWEGEHLFNPGAVAHGGKVYLIYRAEDDFGVGVGFHTSRLGLASSRDGVHFKRHGPPVLFPAKDEQNSFEWPGGCEDPRVVETEEGTFVMLYTQWNRKLAALAVATSNDLVNWEKHGYAFAQHDQRRWSKSGSIVCRQNGDKLIATKIDGKYWMYWGEGSISLAHSQDLIHWTPLFGADHEPLKIMHPRTKKFDSELVECGPPAILTKDGIVLIYNGKNSHIYGDSKVNTNAYSAGQALFDANDPTKLIDRCDDYFLTPEKVYEKNGQYKGGTVFAQGLVHFKGKWLLYYGTADSAIGAAKS